MSGLLAFRLNYQWLMLPLKYAPYTSLLLALSAFVYWALQGPPTATPSNPFEFIGNLFRHKDLLHLSSNLFVIAYAGNHCESVKGGPFMLLVAITSLLTGSIMEYLLIDGRFIGLSAAAYGLAAWSAIDIFGLTLTKSLIITIAFTAIITAGISDTTIVAHAVGALTGGLMTMFGKLFSNKSADPKPVQADSAQTDYRLRPMTMDDIPVAVEIIALTDEDDAEDAEENLAERSCQGMYVLEEAGQMIGLTGFYKSSDVGDIAWLSWTYLHPSAQGKGGGRFMMHEMLRLLDNENIRKLFIATSDYCEDGKPIYASAHALYEALGAVKELQVDDYHDNGEAMIIYGFSNPRFDSVAPKNRSQPLTGIRFQGIHAAAESSHGYEIQWDSSPEMESITGLDNCLSQAQRENARILFVALPEDIAAAESLSKAGFQNCGTLPDYYEKGLGLIYWVLKE
ncbi:MAG: GNAT family N-acetyltransferase [Candidatus Thiodiazotropha sp.]